jgi:DNA-binding Xre family transcriptional regulator
MKRLDNHDVHSYLEDLLKKHKVSGEKLRRETGVSAETITHLRNNEFDGVSRRNIARICAYFGVPIQALLAVLPRDIWLPIRISKKVVVHFGSRVLSEVRPGSDGQGDSRIQRQYLGVSDFRAFRKIQEHLDSLAPDIRVGFDEHFTVEGAGNDPKMYAFVERLFDGTDNHVLIGSQIANRFVEAVVCRAHGVRPFTPENRYTFPYGFAWDRSRHRGVRSSLGWDAPDDNCGVALSSGKVVAPFKYVDRGECTDGALIVVYRVPTKGGVEADPGRHERIIICFLGYSGPGTDAAALLATKSSSAIELYPAAPGKPLMRAISCVYERDAPEPLYDDLDVTNVRLIPEPKSQSPSARRTSKPARSAKKRPRRKIHRTSRKRR